MLPENDGLLTVLSASSKERVPGSPRSHRPVPAEGLQGSAAGPVVAAVASSLR